MNIMNYKDYQIHAVPYQLADTGQWKIDIQILIDRDSETIFRKFSAGNSFESKDKAIRYCFDFGKEIIDEEDTKCTISNL